VERRRTRPMQMVTSMALLATQPSGVPTTFDYDLVAREFFPITFIYVNGYGPGKTQVTITEPNGTMYPTDLNLFVPPCPSGPLFLRLGDFAHADPQTDSLLVWIPDDLWIAIANATTSYKK
jgi:hypothetical protein